MLHEVDGQRTFAVVMDKGDDTAEELVRFARENRVTAARLTAVEACRAATLAYVDPDEMIYHEIPVDQQACGRRDFAAVAAVLGVDTILPDLRGFSI